VSVAATSSWTFAQQQRRAGAQRRIVQQPVSPDMRAGGPVCWCTKSSPGLLHSSSQRGCSSLTPRRQPVNPPLTYALEDVWLLRRARPDFWQQGAGASLTPRAQPVSPPLTYAGGPVCWLLRPARPRLPAQQQPDACAAQLEASTATCQPSPDMHALEDLDVGSAHSSLRTSCTAAAARGCARLTPRAATCQTLPAIRVGLSVCRWLQELAAASCAGQQTRAQAGHL
jgi:hypothetical protein